LIDKLLHDDDDNGQFMNRPPPPKQLATNEPAHSAGKPAGY